MEKKYQNTQNGSLALIFIQKISCQGRIKEVINDSSTSFHRDFQTENLVTLGQLYSKPFFGRGNYWDKCFSLLSIQKVSFRTFSHQGRNKEVMNESSTRSSLN